MNYRNLFGIGLLAQCLLSSIVAAQVNEVDPAKEMAAGVQRPARLAVPAEIAEVPAAVIEARVEALLNYEKARESDGAIEGTSKSARCAAGYVSDHVYKTSDAGAEIVLAALRDCDAGGCREFVVVARGHDGGSVDFSVAVTCSG